MTTNPEPNRYNGQCAVCGTRVPAGTGTRTVLPGNPSWVTVHLQCAPLPQETPRPPQQAQQQQHPAAEPERCACRMVTTTEAAVFLFLCPRHAPAVMVAAARSAQ